MFNRLKKFWREVREEANTPRVRFTIRCNSRPPYRSTVSAKDWEAGMKAFREYLDKQERKD